MDKPEIRFTACPPGSASDGNSIPLPDYLLLAATLVSNTLHTLTQSHRLQTVFRITLEKVAMAHMTEGNPINLDWFLVDWKPWLDHNPIHVHFAPNNIKWGWINRHPTATRSFSILWELAEAASLVCTRTSWLRFFSDYLIIAHLRHAPLLRVYPKYILNFVWFSFPCTKRSISLTTTSFRSSSHR
jgi:hypothetical protein